MNIQVSTDRFEIPDAPRGIGICWLVVLAPPALWLVQFQISYSLASAPVGSLRQKLALGSGIVTIAIDVILILAAIRVWRVADAHPLDALARIGPRIRFMAVLGMMMGSLFILVTLAQLLANKFITPGHS
jgi:hypothetical protein